MLPFVNRELSWLDFNHRVLDEARRADSPLLDRLHFLSITASNLDEFYMVRVAYLHDRSRSAARPDDAGLTAHEQLDRVLGAARAMQQEQMSVLDSIRQGLAGEDIRIAAMDDLDPAQLAFTEQLFGEEILPVLTPLAVDPTRPFPFLLNKSLNIGMRMRDAEGESVFAVVQVPSILPRFVRLPAARGCTYLPVEGLIARHLPVLCDLHPIEAHGLFRITRCADFDAAEDTDDLLEEMKRTLRKRKRGRPIRLELSEPFDPELRGFLEKSLKIKSRYVIELPGLLDLAALGRIASEREHARLRTPPIVPVRAADFAGGADIFETIRERDRMVHHPYESFEHVSDFIESAADDPAVLAIKQTLYRVSGKSRVIAALERAAENGKGVTVLVELKARFDEENNIQWAKRLERAGCHVIYGFTGLKTHCKVTLVVRREADGIRRYLHLGTGNYNDVTARLYTDIGLFTCDPDLGADATVLFNRLTGFSRAPAYRKLIVAPEGILPWFLHKVDEEIERAYRGLPARIWIKANSLLDRPVIEKLFEASRAGVEVRLLIRGICGLVPGLLERSQNIRVRSIVGQLLEHSRVFLFGGAGEPASGGETAQVYLGSADLLPRNLYRRVEVIFPVEEPLLRERLLRALEILWADDTNAWECDQFGIYRRVERGETPLTAQRELSNLAADALREAERAILGDRTIRWEMSE